MKKPVTQKDIAHELNVSVALVSYVLSNKEKEGRVSAKMAQRIRETAARLNYKPNHAARSLKKNRQMTIGCIVADISNPFFAEMARRIEDEAYKLNYTVIFGSSDEELEKFRKLTDFFISRQLDGYLIAPPENGREEIIRLKELNVPLVLIDRYYDDLNLNYVVIDNYEASLKVVDHLVKKGYTRIGMVAYESQMLHFRKRAAGYTDALIANGIKPSEDLLKRVNFSQLRRNVIKEVRELIEQQGVEAIYFAANSLAIEGLKYIFKRGYAMPEEIKVVAFDENTAYSFFRHPIAHVKQPLKEMSTTAIKMLIDFIEGRPTDQPRVYLESSLILEYVSPKSTIKG